MSCNHKWSKECYDVVPSQVCGRCNAFQVEEEHAELVRERDEARAEVEHAYREGGALYEAKIAEREAFRCGAEAMREACAAALMADGLVLSRERAANVVRALPIPEET